MVQTSLFKGLSRLRATFMSRFVLEFKCCKTACSNLHVSLHVLCSYEYEENPTVCACMEGTAELFLADGFEPAPANADDPAADADAQQDGPQSNSGRIVQIEEID